MSDNIIVIAGPTAVGKTKVSIDLALRINGEIVSCDSMQLYQYMDIGSAKPTSAERQMVQHYLIDEIDPRDPFSVAIYQKLAKKYIFEIFHHHKTPLVTGGTGLYLNSLLYDMDFGARPGDEQYRNEMFDFAHQEGNDALHGKLQQVDPVSANRIHPNNTKRVVRALEAFHFNGTGLSDFSSVNKKTLDYGAILIGLTRPREQLYGRIDQRVDELMEAGLLDEVKHLQTLGFTSKDIAMKGIGYKELLDYLSGAYDLPKAVEQIKINTRHFAKRQMTWFKRYPEMHWFEIEENESESETVEKIVLWLNEKR